MKEKPFENLISNLMSGNEEIDEFPFAALTDTDEAKKLDSETIEPAFTVLTEPKSRKFSVHARSEERLKGS